MSDPTSLSEQLSDAEWLSELGEIGSGRGYYKRLGTNHSAIYLDNASETLVVSFDTIATARGGSASGIPHAMLLAEIHGWSHLSIIAKTQRWFRDDALYSFFDDLSDQGVFENFDRVVFYGAGPNGYGAAAFSVAAPGAVVILVSPQATLDPAVAPWDDRFVSMRRTNFNSRYGYAPDMVDAADHVILFYDPLEDLDAMHAALFRGPQISKILVRSGGPQLGRELQDMKVISDVISMAGSGSLRKIDIYRSLRRRHDYMPYLRNLLNRVHVEERHMLVGLLCRTVASRKNAPRFRHHLELAEGKLAAENRTLPKPYRRPSSARLLPELNNN